MKNTFSFIRSYVTLIVACFFVINVNAQFNTLPLISGTDFSVSIGERDYYNSIEQVDGWLGFILPNMKMIGNFAVVDTTNSDANLSHFLSEGKGTGLNSKSFYGINNSSIKLDSLRLIDKDGWGMVLAGGSKGFQYGDAIMTMTVGGLKPGGNYRVEIEYCAPTNKDFTNTQSKLNQNAKTTKRTQNEIGGLLGNVNCTASNYVTLGDKISTSGACNRGTISYNANQQTSGAIGDDGILNLKLTFNSLAPHSALKIKSIKVYGELSIGIRGTAEVCAGGEVSVLTLTNTFNKVKYQWYKNGTAIQGANSTSYTHESGNATKVKTTYYCEITTPNGDKIKSESFTVTDIECCSDKNGNPSSQKLIWMDDFGTFTSATNYWVWDYSDIANPKKVNYRNATKWQRPVVQGVEPPEDANFAVVGGDGDCECPPRHASADNGKFGEGYYTIAGYVTSYGMNGGNNMGWVGYFGNGNEPSKNGFSYAPDHTYGGSDYGGMLYLNIGSDPHAVIYNRTITGLCDRKITVKCYINCFSRGTNPVKVYIRATDLNSGDVYTSDPVTRYNNATAGVGWECAQVKLNLTGTELKFEIVSEIGGNDKTSADPSKKANIDGNDLILDDIMIYACAEPSVNMFFDLDTHAKDSVDCDGSNVKLYVEQTKMIETNIGPEARYLYQYALTDPDKSTSWKTFAGPVQDIVYEDVKSLVKKLQLESGGKVYLRCVLGVESVLKPDGLYNPNEPCGSYSVSEPILLKIDCPTCTKPVDVIISPDLVVDPSSPYKKVQLCEGEHTVLSTKEIKDETGTYKKFRIQWLEGDLNSSPISSTLGNKATDLTVNWSDATEEGVKYYVKVYDDEFPTAHSCYKYDSVLVIANPTPIQSDIVVDPFCENFADWKINFNTAMSVIDVSKYTIQWYSDADCKTPAHEPEMSSTPAGLYDYYIELVDKKSLCVSKPVKVSFNIEANPAPLSASLVQYLKSQETIPSVLVQQPTTLSGVTNDVLWTTITETLQRPSAADSLAAVPVDPTPTIKDKEGTDDEVYYTWVYQRVEIAPNVYCASEMIPVEIDILGAPAPDVTNVSYCVDDPTVEAISNRAVQGSKSDPQKTYELLFYESETSATTIPETTIPSVASAGITTYYVSQRETNTVNESKRVPFTVEVYDVADLSTKNSIDMCRNDKEYSLSAFPGTTSAYVKSENTFFWANDGEEITTSINTVPPTPSTSAIGTTTYQVQPYYQLSATQTCRGKAQSIEVNVYGTDAPTPATIQYIKADADASNIFPELTSKPTWSEDAGFRYYYSVISEDQTKPLSNYTSGAPKPQYDVNTLNGGTKTLYAWVYRISDANAIDCSSDTIMLTIKISDALPPAVKNVYVCEGSPVPDLQAEVQLLPGSTKTAADYDLYWYGTTDPNTNPNASPAQKSGNTYSTGIASAVSVDHAKTEYKYYVTQIDKSTGAESASSEIIVTVLPKPVLDIKALDPTCEKKIDLSAAVTVLNAAECGTVSYVYTDGSGKELTSTEIAATDIYKVTPSYAVSYSGDVIVADAACTGLTYDINAEVDSMSVPTISGPTQACPGESGVQIEASVEHSTFASSDIRYKWSDQQSITGGANSLNTFPDEPGKVFTYTVTAYAGVCEKTSEVHTITVGDGQVKGTMTVTEDGNQLVQGPFVDVVDREFYSCGGDVTISVNYEKTTGDYEWYKNGQPTGVTGPDYKIAATTAVSHDIYEVRFVNKCDASASITVHTIPLTVTPETGAEQKCEKESFSTSLNIVCSETPLIQWMLNGNDISGANAAIYSKSNLKEEEDDGQYSYKVTNRGCVATDNSKSLDVQKYIEMTDLDKPIIVARGEDQTIQLIMNVPTTQTVKTVDWQEKGVSVQNSSSISYTEHSVVADHDYTIYLSDPDYCKTSTTATIWVDAELQLTTTLKDTICLGLSTILEIDTTGTGRFRQAGVTPQLKVVRSTGGEVMDVTSELKKVGDKLQMEVSPTEKAVYTITFDYGNQHKESVEEVYVIEAISLTLPDSPTLCEGESVTLTVTDVLPEGTTVSWEADPTITSSSEGESVTVEPAYTNGFNHSSTYTYTAIAYNAKCNDSKRYEIPVYVDEALKGEIQGSEVICEGDQGRIDASSYDAASYIWNVDTVVVGTGSALSVYPRTTTTYELKMERGTCKAEDSYELKVTSLPVITSVDSIGVRDRSIETEKGKGTGTFYYWVDVESSIATDNEVYNLTFGKHIAYVRDENGCKTSLPFVMVAPEPEIPEWFSPNGDGINDGWVIGKLAEVYPDAKIWIYDRFGKLMIELKGSDTEGWDGTYEGTPMPSTDYWYVVDIEEIDRQYTGHFTLIRQ